MNISLVLDELETYSARGAPTRSRLEEIAYDYDFKYARRILKRELYDRLVAHLIARHTRPVRSVNEELLEELGERCVRYRAPFVPRLQAIANKLGVPVARRMCKQDIYDAIKAHLLRSDTQSIAHSINTTLLPQHVADALIEADDVCDTCCRRDSLTMMYNGRIVCLECASRQRPVRKRAPSGDIVARYNDRTRLTCPLCLVSTIRSPAMTRCGHLYCASCLEELRRVCRSCAICRTIL